MRMTTLVMLTMQAYLMPMQTGWRPYKAIHVLQNYLYRVRMTLCHFYGGDAVATQTLPLQTQLDAGIRVLDIRARLIDNGLAIHHGMVYQHANMDDVFRITTQWLAKHPTEAVVMRVKDEYTAQNSSISWADAFARYVAKYPGYFYTGISSNPPLNEMRGKIAVVHFFPAPNARMGYGDIEPRSFYIQDNYSVSTNWDLYSKWEAVKRHLDEANTAANRGSYAPYMNFLSASGGSFPYFVASGHSSNGTGAGRLATGLTTPGMSSSYPDFPRVSCLGSLCTIAFEGTNVLTANYIQNAQPQLKYVGMVLADFPGMGLIKAVIDLNLKKTIQVFEHSDYQGARQYFAPGKYPSLVTSRYW